MKFVDDDDDDDDHRRLPQITADDHRRSPDSLLLGPADYLITYIRSLKIR